MIQDKRTKHVYIYIYIETNLAHDIFFAGIEFGAFVDVIAAGIASNAHRKHHTHLNLLILRPSHPRQLRRIEVRRVVLVQHFPLSHSLLLPLIPSTTKKKKTLEFDLLLLDILQELILELRFFKTLENLEGKYCYVFVIKNHTRHRPGSWGNRKKLIFENDLILLTIFF